MPPKSLSTTTLALRFMQNAAHKQSRVELDQAHVKDDAEWEVPADVRRAWGVVGAAEETVVRAGATYEPSYIPFLFPSSADQGDGDGEGGGPRVKSESGDDEAASVRPRGRRRFDKHGEVVQVCAQCISQSFVLVTSTPDPVPADLPPATPSEPSTSAKKLLRPKSISSFGKAAASSKHGKNADRNVEGSKNSVQDHSKKTAREAVGDLSGVGTDLRPPRPPGSVNFGSGFLKPQGIDAPVRVVKKEEVASTSTSLPVSPSASSSIEDNIARKKGKKQTRIKRELDAMDGVSGQTGTGAKDKPKKKPKLEMIE
ncbi:hypothetical protein ID866_3273 [Astraeus odoratus]|nr:hypothetical protein ID866_3273 [Astraeus odoratus]